MTIADQPRPDAPGPRNIRLVQLPALAIHALARGDLRAANRAAPLTLTRYFVYAADAVWRMRSAQIRTDPLAEAWITRVIWDVDAELAVGRAGFHGPPDAAGMVEIGYAVDPALRRRGYARAAVAALLDRAAREPAVRTVRASIRPDNLASRALVLQFGFGEVGEQWDDEDGLETLYEVEAGDLSSSGVTEPDPRSTDHSSSALST